MRTRILIVCLFGLNAVGLAQQPAILDLRDVAQPYERSASGAEPMGVVPGKTEGTIGGIAPGMRTSVSASLRVTNVTPDVCTTGQEIVYDLELVNTGRGPLFVPWSTTERPEDLERAGEYRKLIVALMSERLKGGMTTLGSAGVAFGSEAVPGTLRTIAAGERVIVRAAAVCPMTSVGKSHPQGVGIGIIVPVFAELSLGGGPNAPLKSVESPRFNLTVLR